MEVRVLNLAEPERPVALEVVPSLASELLMSVVAVGDIVHESKDADTYDLRARLQALAAKVDADLVRSVDRVTAGYGKVTANLLGLVYARPSPRDVDAFIRHLDGVEPLELLLHLLGYHIAGHRRLTPPEVIRRAAEGDPEARERFLTDSSRTSDDLVRAQKDLLARDPNQVKEALTDFLRSWNDEIFADLAPEAIPVLERDAVAKRALSASNTPERTVELATNGVQFTRDPGIERVVLFPTYVLRPWVLVSESNDLKIFCYPVGDESLDVGESVPPPSLVKLYKALGDSSRLRLLRRLAAGPLTLKEATDLLGSAKSTAYHHLAILRQAGLVWMREEEDKTYTLRADLIPHAGELLQAYLGRDDAGGSPRERLESPG